MFHRQDMHQMLLRYAMNPSEELKGPPAKLVKECKCIAVDCDEGTVEFADGLKIKADLIVGADGIRVGTLPFL